MQLPRVTHDGAITLRDDGVPPVERRARGERTNLGAQKAHLVAGAVQPTDEVPPAALLKPADYLTLGARIGAGVGEDRTPAIRLALGGPPGRDRLADGLRQVLGLLAGGALEEGVV